MQALLTSFIVGLSYAMPLGAQNVYVIRSSIGLGVRKFFKVALIVSFFDISLALICFFGAGELIARLPNSIKSMIFFAGGLYILKIAYDILKDRKESIVQDDDYKEESSQDLSMRKLFTTFFVLTFLNPQAIIDGSILIGNLRMTTSETTDHLVIIGLSIASLIWFTFLSFISALFREKLTNKLWEWISLFCSSVLSIIGIKFIYEAFNIFSI